MRASNTEPLLRLNVEAADRETMQDVRDELLALIRSGAAARRRTRRGRVHHRPGRRRRFVSQSQQTIEPWLRGIIRCPQCKGEVIDAVATDDAAVPQVTELRCDTCHLAYPVEGGVPVLLVDLARRTDG